MIDKDEENAIYNYPQHPITHLYPVKDKGSNCFIYVIFCVKTCLCYNSYYLAKAISVCIWS